MTHHLWEYDHPYFCAEATFFQNSDGSFPHEHYESWTDFTETVWFSGDRDLNYLVRWDWFSGKVRKDWDGADILSMAFVVQRKGYLSTVEVDVTEKNESAVRTFLEACARAVQTTWEPLLALATAE